MKISTSSKLKPADNLLLLGYKNSDFNKYLHTEEEKKYLKKRIKDDDKQILINQFSRMVYVNIIEKEAKKDRIASIEKLRKNGASYRTSFKKHKVSSIVIVQVDCDSDHIQALAEGIALSHYQFLKYFKEKDKKEYSLKNISVFGSGLNSKQFTELETLVRAVYKTRDLVNEPLSYLTAPQLSVELEQMADEAGFKIEVLTKKKIEALKMGGLLAVNKGSIDPPTFNILEYKPAKPVNKKPIVLVGKGVVYDTGGLSLKPTADSMDYMKSDMAGAAAVAGIFYAVASNKLNVHIIGLIPATDNRPDGNAYVPGDVVKMYDGTSVEVLNTDAEGRMILADALAYAKQYDPELVIDLATLTGAAWAAIGTEGLVGMGNAPGKIMASLVESGYAVYERIAEFPFWDEYGEMMKSDIADLKNIGGRVAGAITAGKFLEHFTDYPYIHLDIAGPSFLKKEEAYRTKGGSGVGVRLLYHYLSGLTK